MKQEELEKKYGKAIIKKIIREGYLNGCTVGINQDGTDDIYEIDIINVIKEMKGIPYAWD
ncbi:MAG: hypothetical protein AABW80_03120 [Nanoarchaeota archaeon]